jgi:hypothetical protein
MQVQVVEEAWGAAAFEQCAERVTHSVSKLTCSQGACGLPLYIVQRA